MGSVLGTRVVLNELYGFEMIREMGIEYAPLPNLVQSILRVFPVSRSRSTTVSCPAMSPPFSSGMNPSCSRFTPNRASTSSMTASLSGCSLKRQSSQFLLT